MWTVISLFLASLHLIIAGQSHVCRQAYGFAGDCETAFLVTPNRHNPDKPHVRPCTCVCTDFVDTPSGTAAQVYLSYFGEYGYELLRNVPFAYWLHTRGLLHRTVGAKDTTSLYYFSPNHQEHMRIKHQANCNEGADAALPGGAGTAEEFLTRGKMLPPPYKQHYANSLFRFPKPLLIIHNKYAVQWGLLPNAIDLTTLEELFKVLAPHFIVVYFRYGHKKGTVPPDRRLPVDMHMRESGLLWHYNITDFYQLYTREYRQQYSHNTFMMMMHASCERFVTVQGGGGILASFFGGINIMLARRGMETLQAEGMPQPYAERVFPALGNSTVVLANTNDRLLAAVKKHLIDGAFAP